MSQRYRFPNSFPHFCGMACVYISAGSNLGDRLSFLQHGLKDVAQRIGKVLAISSVVETPALGFEGNPFFNTCFLAETMLSPQKVMKILIEIEKHHGRIRSTAKGYKNRTLDLDLLFYDEKIMQTRLLTLPHPELENRRFVLHPLAEIAPNKAHPILQKTISELLEKCTDKTVITILEERLKNID